jgi:hypothetical protein
MAVALLIGISQYEDASFSSLPSAVKDVEALQDVLRHPDIGTARSSDVLTLTNPDGQGLRSEIETLLANCQPNDVVLLYFSGYGVVDDKGNLFLTSRTTQRSNLAETALSMAELQSWLEASRSHQQILIFDCCFSGTYTQGMVAPADVDKIGKYLSGKRRAFMTSPWSIEYSPQEKSGTVSIYTQYLLNALSTGMADGTAHRNLDGETSVLELHEYICDRLEPDLPAASPRLYTVGQGYEIAIARAPYLDFRKEALGLASRGEISLVGHRILEELGRKTGVPDPIANAIKQDALKPYQIQRNKRQQFESLQSEITKREGQLSDNTRTELMRLQELYELQNNVVRPDTTSNTATSDTARPDAVRPDTPVSPLYASPESAGVGQTSVQLNHSMDDRTSRMGQTLPPLSDAYAANGSGQPLVEVPPTELEQRQPSRFGQRVSQFFEERNLPRDFSAERWRIAIAGLAVLGLLAAVLWALFQPIPRSANKISTAEDFFQDAYRKAQGNDRQGAIDGYTQAITLNPSNPNFYYNRGIEYSRGGNKYKHQAIQDYDRAIQLDPAFADAYFNRANANASLGENKAALQDYQQAAKLYQQQKLPQERQRALAAAKRLQGQ